MDDQLTVRDMIDELLPERLERLRQVTGLPVVLGGSTRHGDDGRALVLDRLIGTVGDSLRGLAIQPGKGLGGRVLSRRAPLRVHDYATEIGITHDYDQVVLEEGLTSVLAVPLLIRGQVRGVLYGAVHDRRHIGDRAVRSAVVLAEQLQQDVESWLRGRPGERGGQSQMALTELAAVIRETADPALRARLIRIRQELSGPCRSARLDTKSILSPRETDTLRLVEVGESNLEIAARLGLSLETVKAYLRSAMRKLDVHNRTAAAHRARQSGVL